jgi:hypothetical protein
MATAKRQRVADVVVTSALDLQTAFGIGEALKTLCLQFEPKIQTHTVFLDEKLKAPLSVESLEKALESLVLFPDDFLTDVVEYVDKMSYSIQVRSIIAYDYMSMVAAGLQQHVQRGASSAAIRIRQSGIQTADNQIIH